MAGSTCDALGVCVVIVRGESDDAIQTAAAVTVWMGRAHEVSAG